MPSSISVALQKHLGRDKKRTQSGGQLPIVSGRQHPPPILSDHAEEDPCILDDNGLADLWDEALYHYAQTTGVDLTDENTDLSQQLKNCAGYRDVVIALDRVAQAFEVYRNPHNGIGTRIRKALRPVVRAVISSGVLEASGETAASKAVPGGKALFVAVGLLLKATEGVSARFDALTKLLEKFHFFVTRLDVRTKSADLRTASRTLATRIFCNMLRTLAIAHKMMQRNRLEHFIVVLIGQGSDVSDLYRQTEDLMEEDVRLSLAELHDTVNDLTKLHIALERMEVGIHNITSGVNDISHRVRASQVDIANLSTTFSEYAGYSRLNLDSIHQAILELPGRIQAQIAIIPHQGVESNATTLNVATTVGHVITTKGVPFVGVAAFAARLSLPCSDLVSFSRVTDDVFAYCRDLPLEERVALKEGIMRLYTVAEMSVICSNTAVEVTIAGFMECSGPVLSAFLPMATAFLAVYGHWKMYVSGSNRRIPRGPYLHTTIFADVLGDTLVLPLYMYNSLNDVHEFLLRKFSNEAGKEVIDFVRTHAYRIMNSGEHSFVVEAETWKRNIRSGIKLEMSVVVSQHSHLPRSPWCRKTAPKILYDAWISCHSCGGRYWASKAGSRLDALGQTNGSETSFNQRWLPDSSTFIDSDIASLGTSLMNTTLLASIGYFASTAILFYSHRTI